MRSIFFAAMGVLCSLMSIGQVYTGPIQKPLDGYGVEGDLNVATITFQNPNYPSKDIVIYYPEGISEPVPALFYSHAYGGNDPSNVSGFLEFVAKKGFAVVFVPYQTFLVSQEERYSNLLNGFVKAGRDYANILDTTRVGFVGHSFGGGAVLANAYHCFVHLNWGRSGRFMLTMAPWYAYNISQQNLESFPNDVKFLSIVYQDDLTNDHRMANDIFNSINIPSSEKDYLRVQSDTIEGYIYAADHVVPNNSDFNALDYYAYFRLLDALCDYTFNGSLEAKQVALGNGSSDQVSLPGGLKNLIHSEVPVFANDPDSYTFPCDSEDNPRRNRCEMLIESGELVELKVVVFPNPADDLLYINASKEVLQVNIFDQSGQLLITAADTKVPISDLPAGLYLVKIEWIDHSMAVENIVKE